MSKQVTNFFWYLIQYSFKNLIPILILPIVTEFISVKDFGMYALATIYGVFCSGLINLGLSSVFERNFFELCPRKRKDVLFTIFVFILFNYLGMAIFTFHFSDEIASGIFQQNQLKDFLLITLTFQSFKSFNQYFLSYLKNYENAKKHTYISIFESLLSTGLALIFVVYASMGIYGFIFGQSIGVFVVFTLTFIYLFFPFQNRFDLNLLKAQLSLSLPLTPRIFFGVINTQFDRYMLGLLGAVGGVGVYDIGQKLANTTFTFMTALQNIFSPQVYKKFFSDDPHFRNSVGVYLTPFFYLSVFVCLVLGVFSYEFLYLLTPEEFHDAAPIVSILSLLYGFYFFAKQPQLLFAKKTALISLITLLTIGLNIALNLPMIYYFGEIGAACATATAGVISTGISFYYGQKYTPIRYEKEVYLILLYFIIAIVGSLFLSSLNTPYQTIIIIKCLFIIFYVYAGWQLGILNIKLIDKLNKNLNQ